jgi:hypothetical protein
MAASVACHQHHHHLEIYPHFSLLASRPCQSLTTEPQPLEPDWTMMGGGSVVLRRKDEE